MGNKKKLSSELQTMFPKHSVYIEPLFGAGGMFFNKPKAKYNIVNDIDGDVYNLFMVVMKQKEELRDAFFKMPIHTDLLEYYKNNEEAEPLQKAIRFLFLSNLTIYGAGQTIKFGTENPKLTFQHLDETFALLTDVQFMNKDFRKFLKSIQIKQPENFFIYCDPPYLETNDNYSDSFKEEDVVDLFDSLEKTKCRFGYSEFNHPFLIEEAERRGLVVNYLGERQNLKNRSIEVLITNYQARHTLF